jgi:hypothetical protein
MNSGGIRQLDNQVLLQPVFPLVLIAEGSGDAPWMAQAEIQPSNLELHAPRKHKRPFARKPVARPFSSQMEICPGRKDRERRNDDRRILCR